MEIVQIIFIGISDAKSVLVTANYPQCLAPVHQLWHLAPCLPLTTSCPYSCNIAVLVLPTERNFLVGFPGYVGDDGGPAQSLLVDLVQVRHPGQVLVADVIICPHRLRDLLVQPRL